jgi:hypothetical protein
MGIAYAYPSMIENYYGVINHTNEEGFFRISSDQSTTPGMKFWTWGDTQGQAANPNNFNNVERPYIELWSGVSHEFFDDAFLAANDHIKWTEFYFPTVGMPGISFLDQNIAFYSKIENDELSIYSFLPTTSAFTIDIEIASGSEVMYTSSKVVPTNTQTTNVDLLNLSSLDLIGNHTVTIALKSTTETIFTEQIPFNNPLALSLSQEQRTKINITSQGLIQLNFYSVKNRVIRLVDFQGRVHNQINSQAKFAEIKYSNRGLYIIQIQENDASWTKKIRIH